MDMEWEEYIEEIKFQMTDYEELTKEIILDWEARAGKWMRSQLGKNPRFFRRREDVYIRIAEEDDMFRVAQGYHEAVIKGRTEQYWKQFRLG